MAHSLLSDLELTHVSQSGLYTRIRRWRVRLFSLLFAIVGFYLLIGRFLIDMWLRARTQYGLTERQAIIVSNGFSQQIRYVNLKTLSDLKLTLRRDGRGTIELGKPKFNIFGPRTSRAMPSLGTGQYLPPAFEAIPDARRVYDLIVQAQYQAQHS